MKNEEKQIWDLIIIGGGPAGITAGIFAGRQKLKTLLITKEFGGQMKLKAVSIENYPGFPEISGEELISKFVDHLKKYPVEILLEEAIKVKKENEFFKIITEKNNSFFSKAVILAVGAKPRILEIKGEKEFLGKGVSYCPICDGYFFKEKQVAVIGGGNAGFESALFLSQIAKKIYILDFSETPKADKELQERVEETKKVEFIGGVKIKEITGKDFVEGIIYEEIKTNKEFILPVSGVFIHVGTVPQTFLVEGLVEFNEKKEIKVNPETLETKTPGLFAAGDCTEGKFKQIAIAVGQGAKSALYAFEYLKGKR
jgi:thioredoxin-disulfide reductase